MAMALQGQVASITAVDRDPRVLVQAKGLGIVDRASSDVASTLESTDLLILAVPVKQIIAFLKWLPSAELGSIAIIDLGSTKNEICRLFSILPERYEAIGGHPMCGREKSGLGAAEANLYQDQPFVLCRTSATTTKVENIALNLVHSIGAQPLFLPPDIHDETVAASSHLPYIISVILMDVVNTVAQENPHTWTVSATGLRDTSRLAGSDPQMMLDILMSNREAILERLEAYSLDLHEFTKLLEKEEDQLLLQRLKDIQKQYWTYRRNQGSFS